MVVNVIVILIVFCMNCLTVKCPACIISNVCYAACRLSYSDYVPDNLNVQPRARKYNCCDAFTISKPKQLANSIIQSHVKEKTDFWKQVKPRSPAYLAFFHIDRPESSRVISATSSFSRLRVFFMLDTVKHRPSQFLLSLVKWSFPYAALTLLDRSVIGQHYDTHRRIIFCQFDNSVNLACCEAR